MKKIIMIVLLLEAYVLATNYSLFTDKRGRKSGDIVTVLVMEASKASNDTRTQTTSKDGMDIGVGGGTGALKWIPGAGMKAGVGVEFDGQGATTRNGQLKATVTARILQVMENGNLLVEGSKLVTINNEEEILEVSGMIRADDINPDNTVFSYKIADAVIRYTGNGVNSSAQEPGVLTRFLNWLF
jgi:flagellar L-ring protein precursor FlgH